MADTKHKFKNNLDDIRKIHPNAGMRWSEEESENLLGEYQICLEHERDFEEFVLDMGRKFGRGPNGIRGRLALSFPDIPGWDYEAANQRKADKQREKLENAKVGANPVMDKILTDEYNKYVLAKSETFKKFVSRLTKLIGKPRMQTKARLFQLVESPVEYTEEDLGETYKPKVNFSEPEVVNLDFSINLEMAEAFKLMEKTRENIFLTGEAGTGKSTLLRYFKLNTRKNTVVLAPTGVAAINAGGQTIHSFCAFGPDITIHKVKKATSWGGKKQLLQKLSTIIIDEISMVRADLLDCVDKFLRMNGPDSKSPFGGVQMIFVGDLHQLPPVDKDFTDGGLFQEYKSPYFFDSHSFATGNFKLAELKIIYRQKDRVFLEILNAVRNNAVSTEHLEILNRRSTGEGEKFTFEQFAVYLTPTNARAGQVNEHFLSKLPSKEKVFQGFASGKLEDKAPPGEATLRLKVGAQIMMLNNDMKKRWVNGTMGKVIGFVKPSQTDDAQVEKNELVYEPEDEPEKQAEEKDLLIQVELESGDTVYVGRHTWEMFNFYLDKKSDKIESKTVGTFTQYPLKPAWALTIHKSQGKTFDKVYVDLAGGTFAHGQLYVALSRCRTLEGLQLKRPVVASDILLDNRIVEFLTGLK